MTRKKFDAGDRVIVRQDRLMNHAYEFRDHPKFIPNDRARLAMDMATRWGMVAARPDGEDTTGRAKIGLLEPSEIVSRAVETADGIMTEIERRGWLQKMPDVDDIYADDEQPT